MVTLNQGTSLGRSKRARAFPPLNLPGLQAWYDATDSATITQSGGLVSQLIDKSTNARHVTSSGAARPSASAGYISFNGSSQYLFNNLPFLYNSGNYAVYAVIDGTPANYGAVVAEGNSVGSSSYCPVMTGSGGANAEITPYILTDSGNVLRANVSLGAVSHTNSKKIIRVCEKFSHISSYVDGTFGITPRTYTRTSSLTTDRFAIGARINSVAGFFGNFKLYEMIIVGSDAYGQQIEGYLAAKHGLTANLPATHPYKSRAPMMGQTTSYPIEVKTSGAITAALMGDSITAFNSGILSDTYNYGTAGYFVNYNLLSRQRMIFPVSYNKGVSGQRTTDMISRMATDLGPLTFDRCFLLAGTNDISNGDSQESIRDNLDTLLNYITITKGKTAIILTIMPRTHGTDAVSRKARIVNLNDFIMKSHGTREGRVIAVDVYTTLNDGNDEPIANSTADGLHPSSYGAMLLGRDINTRLQNYYGPGSYNFSTGNLLGNGILAGTGGTVGSNAAGTIATSYAFTGSGGTNGRMASKNGDGSQRLGMVVTGGTTADKMTLTQSISSGFSSGDTLYGMALVEIVGTPANITRSGLEINLTSTQTLKNASAMDSGLGQIAEHYMTPGIYLLQTPDLPLTATPTSVQWKYEMVGDSSVTATSGIVNILGAGIFKR